jgi:hypothetical protein
MILKTGFQIQRNDMERKFEKVKERELYECVAPCGPCGWLLVCLSTCACTRVPLWPVPVHDMLEAVCGCPRGEQR